MVKIYMPWALGEVLPVVDPFQGPQAKARWLAQRRRSGRRPPERRGGPLTSLAVFAGLLGVVCAPWLVLVGLAAAL